MRASNDTPRSTVNNRTTPHYVCHLTGTQVLVSADMLELCSGDDRRAPHANLVGLVADITASDERNRIVNTHKARSGLRTLLGLVAALGMVAAMAMPALAASVTPTPINDGNPTCSAFGAGWSQLKVEPPGNGNFTDGTLEITISNFVNSSSGTPGSFDWTSNIGVDAVFVKAGNDKHNLYVYDPESLGDTDLGPQAGNGNGISHISFCYDAGGPSRAAPTPTDTPNEGELGGNPTPTPAPLPDTAMVDGGATVPVVLLSLMLSARWHGWPSPVARVSARHGTLTTQRPPDRFRRPLRSPSVPWERRTRTVVAMSQQFADQQCTPYPPKLSKSAQTRGTKDGAPRIYSASLQALQAKGGQPIQNRRRLVGCRRHQ